MASIKNIKPDQILYLRYRYKMGNTTIRKTGLYLVHVKEVFDDHVVASVNGNPAKQYKQQSVDKWLVSKPKPKSTIMGVDSY